MGSTEGVHGPGVHVLYFPFLNFLKNTGSRFIFNFNLDSGMILLAN